MTHATDDDTVMAAGARTEASSAGSPEPAAAMAALRGLVDHLQSMSQRLTEAQANGLYADAYHLLQAGNADKAAMRFGMLALFRPDEARAWHGLGLCCRRAGDAAAAANAFAQAFERQPQQLEPGLLLAESLLLLGQRDAASALLARIERAAEEQNDAAARMRASGLRELIERPLQ
jgi:Flp pilus assembly protein TadD